VSDLTAILLVLVVPVGLVIALVVPARSRRWVDDHPVGARRSGILGGALGLAVAVFWAGRFLELW